MFTFDDYPFQSTRVPEPHDLPDGYYHILPYRVPLVEASLEPFEQAKADFARAVGKESSALKLDAKNVAFVRFICPECPPGAFAHFLYFATILALWDGMYDRTLIMRQFESSLACLTQRHR
jgi:hypothetical protein